MATCKVFSSMAVPPLGMMPVSSCLSARKASYLNALSGTNLPALSLSMSRGEGRARNSCRTSRVLAAASSSEGSEGAQAKDAVKKRENGVPFKRESTSMERARGRSRPLTRSLATLDDFSLPLGACGRWWM